MYVCMYCTRWCGSAIHNHNRASTNPACVNLAGDRNLAICCCSSLSCSKPSKPGIKVALYDSDAWPHALQPHM